MLGTNIMFAKYTKKFINGKSGLVTQLIVVLLAVYVADYLLALGLFKGIFSIETFNGEQEAAKAAKLTCTMYYTEWCGYCKKAKPEWAKLTDEYDNKTMNGTTILITKVNCEENPELAKEQNIQGYPTFKFSLDGQEVAYNGERTYNAFKKFIDGIVHTDRS